MSNEENKAPEQNAGTVEQPTKPVEKAHYEVNPKRPVFKAATDEQKKRVDWIGRKKFSINIKRVFHNAMDMCRCQRMNVNDNF